jgi:hypothetical protein
VCENEFLTIINIILSASDVCMIAANETMFRMPEQPSYKIGMDQHSERGFSMWLPTRRCSGNAMEYLYTGRDPASEVKCGFFGCSNRHNRMLLPRTDAMLSSQMLRTRSDRKHQPRLMDGSEILL